MLTAVPLFLGCEFCRRQKNFMSEKIDYSKGVYDARQLGAGRMFILGVQHMFAMFGATVLLFWALPLRIWAASPSWPPCWLMRTAT